MLTNLAFIVFLALTNTPAPHPATSDRVVTVSFKSQALAGQERYLVWLPPGYRKDAARVDYPVVVLLHGLGGEGADWFDPKLGDLGVTLDRMLADGRIAPFIALAPDGGGGYWTDHLGKPRERYGAFIDEVIANAEKRFDIADNRAAIVGVSMGGHGAMSRALMAPERYRAVVSLSGALFAEPPTHRPIYKKVWGFPADRAHWEATAPLAIAQHLAGDAKLPGIFLACGREDVDRFLDWNTEASRILAARGIQHDLFLVEGGHSWTTWRSLTERWLAWLAPRLR